MVQSIYGRFTFPDTSALRQPPCLQPRYHRYRQLPPHPHLNCTIPQKMRYLHPHRPSVPAGRSTLFLLVQIKIPTLNPYRRHAASQAKTSYPNDQNALPVFHNTQRTSNRIRKEKSWTWRESSNFETAVLACMIKQKFGPFSHVGGDDRLIDKVNPR